MTANRSVRIRQMLGLSLVGLAALIGGGGISGPLQSLVIEVLGVLALGWIFVIAPVDFADRGLRAPLIWMAVFVAIVVIQLIPLPPALWKMIPGKQLEWTTAGLIGLDHVWRPIALVPEKSILSALALVPCAAIFLLLYRSDEDTQAWLGWGIVGFAVLNAAFGLIQTYGGNDAAYLYETSHHGSAVGLFGNRNHFAVFEVVGLVWLTAGLRGLRERGLGVLLGAVLAYGLILLAIVASGSRTGAAITLVALSVLPFFLVPAHMRRQFVILWCIGIAGAIMLIWLGASVYPESSLGRLLTRYTQGDMAGDEGRWTYWVNSIFVVRQTFPFGSGLGSFVQAYQANEPLSALTKLLTNHAHNDYIEFVLELGLVGVLLIAGAAVWLWRRATRAFGALGLGMRPFHAALLSVMAIAAASLTDYPIRMYAVAAILAACLAIIASVRPQDDKSLRRSAK